MSEKENILSKLNIKDYRKNLELVLEEKDFDDESKSLILNIFYKIDNFYKDYTTVKKQSELKVKFLENYINIIKNKCNKIRIISPQNWKTSKKHRVNKKLGEIQSFPNEVILMYAIYELNEENIKCENFLSNCITKVIEKGSAINSIEPIRDFNGWSWNIDINNINNIEYNLVFQNLIILFGFNFINDNINNVNIVQTLNEKIQIEGWNEAYLNLFDCLLDLCFSMYNNISLKNNANCVKYKEKTLQKIKELNDIQQHTDDILNENKKLLELMSKINIVLNNDNLLKREFEKNREKESIKCLSVSDFADNLEFKKEKILKIIDNNNALLNPNEFFEYYNKYEKNLNACKMVQPERKFNIQLKLLNFEKAFMECLKEKIQNITNKKELFNMLIELRYYANIPLNKNENIINNEKLTNIFNETAQKLISKMIEYKIIDLGLKDENLNFNILKYIFKSKTIKLDNMVLKIKFIENTEIQVEYYDANMLEHKETFDIPFGEDISNKKDKKIKLFKIGG